MFISILHGKKVVAIMYTVTELCNVHVRFQANDRLIIDGDPSASCPFGRWLSQKMAQFRQWSQQINNFLYLRKSRELDQLVGVAAGVCFVQQGSSPGFGEFPFRCF